MSKNNARLEWKGRKLMCGPRCVADIGWSRDYWYASGNDFHETRATEAAARRAVNRRFKLPADFGVKS
jgi:hypothetical protein